MHDGRAVVMCLSPPPFQDVVVIPEHTWREALDPTTKQIYYYNTETKETQWMRPTVMGAAPSGTGWCVPPPRLPPSSARCDLWLYVLS